MTVTTPDLGGGANAVGTVTYTYDAQDRLTRELSQRQQFGRYFDRLTGGKGATPAEYEKLFHKEHHGYLNYTRISP